MTDLDFLQAFKRGERIKPELSMHDSVKDVGPHLHNWRCIVCCYDEGQDVSECRECGEQTIHACTFDDDYK